MALEISAEVLGEFYTWITARHSAKREVNSDRPEPM
jgi:hypothetical protein